MWQKSKTSAKGRVVLGLVVLDGAVAGLTSTHLLRHEAVVSFSTGEEDELTQIEVRCPAGWLFMDFGVSPQNESQGGALITSHGSLGCPTIGAVQLRTSAWPPLSQVRVPHGAPTQAFVSPSGNELWMLLAREPASDTQLDANWREASGRPSGR